MSTTNAQASIAAAANISVYYTDARSANAFPPSMTVDRLLSAAHQVKTWLDAQDAADARAASIASKGTLEDRVTAIENKIEVA